VREKYKLTTDHYEFKQGSEKYARVFVHVEDDTLSIYDEHNKVVPLVDHENYYFLKRSLDIDVLIMPFKYRPGASGFPRQLNTSFNGNIFLGYRVDRFSTQYKNTPLGLRKEQGHHGLSLGVFGGLGSAFISPWTTNYQTTDEYDGFILSRGISLLAGVNNLTVGVAVGWDYLTDRDQEIWIYQNKPWYGVAIGLNLN
jgi:hypothetical protein